MSLFVLCLQLECGPFCDQTHFIIGLFTLCQTITRLLLFCQGKQLYQGSEHHHSYEKIDGVTLLIIDPSLCNSTTRQHSLGGNAYML